MQSNFERCIKDVLWHEGGYVNHPSDPGGITNMGVTKRVWEEWIGHDVSAEEMRALTVAEVTPLYKKRYWDVCRCDELHAGLDYVVFDIAVNSGTGRAAKFLQSAVGVAADGSIGPRTIAAVGASELSTKELINIICDRRQKFWESLATFATFGKGWTRRGDSVRKEALSMVS